MSDSNALTIIAVNGEIYNFQDLRRSLCAAGHEFKSNSDSEVLLHGFNEWGIERLLSRIKGMYALVIYDKRNGKIFLARDRVGIKPLYYSRTDSHLSWSSELKALVSFYDGSLKIDQTALYDFLTYLYTPTPKTCYRNVYKLPPAHFVQYDIAKKSLIVQRYWELEPKEVSVTIDEASEQLREHVAKAVKEQLVSDVEVGFFLSGGLDSSVIVASAAGVSDAINTYSIGFDDERHDETHYAKIVADHYHTCHQEKILTVDDASQLIMRMKGWFDEPFGDTSALPTYLVSCFAREHCRVVLSGDGGDELFGGYRFYNRFNGVERNQTSRFVGIKRLAHRLRRTFNWNPTRRIANKAIEVMSDEMELHLYTKGGMLREEKDSFRRHWGIDKDYDDYWVSRKYWRPELPLKTRLQYLDFNTSLHDDMLTKVDRVSMAVGLEARVPLLAEDIVTFCFSLPEDIRYHGQKLKGLLKHAYVDALPQSIIERSKKGFSVPIWRNALFNGSRTRQEGLLKLYLASPHIPDSAGIGR